MWRPKRLASSAYSDLNGQLSRRSVDVHFPRYRAESAADRKAFLSVLNSFAQQLPLPDPADLARDWEFLYERSVGCVGVLKQWLIRSLSVGLRTGEATLSRHNLESQAPSVAQADKIISEAGEGEMRLMDSNEAVLRLREQLGLIPLKRSQQSIEQPVQALAQRAGRRPTASLRPPRPASTLWHDAPFCRR